MKLLYAYQYLLRLMKNLSNKVIIKELQFTKKKGEKLIAEKLTVLKKIPDS